MATKRKADDVIRALRKKLEKSGNLWALTPASEVHNAFDLRRPSGIPSLDLATGGGLPAGGISEIGGREGIGKNYLSNRYIQNVQKNYGDDAAVLFVCFESTYDKDFGRACGVNVAYDDYEIDILNAERTSNGEKKLSKKKVEELKTQLGRFDIIRAEPEVALSIVLDVIRANTHQLVVIDSWDVVEPQDARDKDLEDTEKVGNRATLQTRFSSKFFYALNNHENGEVNETTIIALRQLRASMSTMRFAKTWKISGAHALKHANLGQIILTQGMLIKGPSKEALGKEVNWEVSKGKAGFHDGPKGTFNYYYDPPRVDVIHDFIGVMSKIKALKGDRRRGFKLIDGDQVLLEAADMVELQRHLQPESDLWEMGMSMAYEHFGIHGIRFS